MDARIEQPLQPDETSSRQGRVVRRVTWVGLGVNVGLSAFKLAGGLLGHSQAVVADAVHSLSDTSTDVAILVGVRYWSQPADATHPHGHRRIETMVTLFIGLLLAAVAGGLGYRAISTLPAPPPAPPKWIAFFATVVSIVSKELLFRWSRRAGRRIKSTALVANAWHHRSDALSSLPAALAVLGARLNPEWHLLDHVGAVVVSLFIIQAAWVILRPAFAQLIDAGAPEKDRKALQSLACEVEGVVDAHAVRTRYMGANLGVDLHIRVDGDMSVRRGHAISEKVKRHLLAKGPDVVDVVVHLEPDVETPADGEAPPEKPLARSVGPSKAKGGDALDGTARRD